MSNEDECEQALTDALADIDEMKMQRDAAQERVRVLEAALRAIESLVLSTLAIPPAIESPDTGTLEEIEAAARAALAGDAGAKE